MDSPNSMDTNRVGLDINIELRLNFKSEATLLKEIISISLFVTRLSNYKQKYGYHFLLKFL